MGKPVRARVSLPAIRYSNERHKHLSKAQQEALLGAYVAHVRPIALMLCVQGPAGNGAVTLHGQFLRRPLGAVPLPIPVTITAGPGPFCRRRSPG